MHVSPLSYQPPRSLVERVRLYILSTAWHADLMAEMQHHASMRLQAYEVPPDRIHRFTVAGSFELVHLAGAIVNRYRWLRRLKEKVHIQGTSLIETYPPHEIRQSELEAGLIEEYSPYGIFQGDLEARFALEVQGGLQVLQPYEPDQTGDLPAILVMGCILKGATPHYQFLAQAVFNSLAELNRDSGVPVILGILTPETMRQAQARTPQAADWVAAVYMSWEARLSLLSSQNPTV